MGEIADLMINGDICEQCGVELGSEGDGYPRLCADCAKTTLPLTPTARDPLAGRAAPKVQCPACKRFVKVLGLSDHYRSQHMKPKETPRGTPDI